MPEKKPPKGTVIETLAAGSASVVVETIEPAASASPEALRQYQLSQAPIEHRQGLNDGFTATFGGQTHVLRERHNRWYDCYAAVTNDAMRDEVIAACKSYKLPAGP
ncbi:MAG TPA: hypothetical protein VL326_26570 [Kofleriaceae bacterium]|nr:hypothetical protein [Kofleriaceae bacterium]